MESLLYLPPLLFPVFWLLICFMMSKFGWQKLVDRYQVETGFPGERLGLASMKIGQASYTNAIVVRYDHHGIYLRPIVFFRAFHKTVFVPWKEINVAREKVFFISSTQLNIGDPVIAQLTVSGDSFDKVPEELYQHYKLH